jgi:DNA topoisomerase-3
MHRDGRELVPTAKAFSLITLLRGLGVTELTSPELTGEWEYKLAQMERGRLSRDEFMGHITGPDPGHRRAGQALRVRHRARRLRHPADALPEVRRRGEGELQEVRLPGLRLERLEDRRRPPVRGGGDGDPAARGQGGPAAGFRNKMGRPFDAEIRLNDDKQPEFDFRPAQGGRGGRGGGFLRPGKPGQVPQVRRPGLPARQRLSSARSVGPAKSCDFRSGKVILQQPVERASRCASC